MRNVKWLAAAALALATTGCVEQMDGNYSSDGYVDNGYYAAAPTYYTPYYEPTRVVTRTQYVPVPVQEPRRTFQADRRSNDQRDEHTANRGDHRQQPQQQSHTQSNGSQASNSHQGGSHVGNAPSGGNRQANSDNNRGNGNNRRPDRDRDGDGKPDRRG